MGLVLRSLVMLSGLSLLAACGEQVVKEQAATSFVTASQKAVDTTQQFYKDLVDANTAYNRFRWAVDAQCPLLSPGERLTAPGMDDPTALPLAIERLPHAGQALPRACAAYVAEACHRESNGAFHCRPSAGTVTANGFFCPSSAAQSCAPALSDLNWKRVSPYTDNPVNASFQYVSLAASDFSADTASIQILVKYLDSLSSLTKHPDQDIGSELSHDAGDLQTLGHSLQAALVSRGKASSTGNKKGVSASSAVESAQSAASSTATPSPDEPFSSLSEGIQATIHDGGSLSAIAKVLSSPGTQNQVGDAIEQLAKAVDNRFCSTQPVDAAQSASDIRAYLGFGYGPDDLAAREALVKQSMAYQTLVTSNINACKAAQQANADDAHGAYHPASPSAVLLMGVKRANDALVKEIVNGQLTDADRRKAREINVDEFESAMEQAITVVTSLKGL